MTSITALNVRLGMDAANFAQGAELARSEVNKIVSVMRRSVPPAEAYQKQVDLLNQAFNEQGRRSKEYADAIDYLQKRYKQGAHSAEAMAAAQKLKADAEAAAIEQAKAAAAEEARLARIRKEGESVTRSLLTADQQHAAEVRRLSDLYKAQAISRETLNRGIKQADAALAASNPAVQRRNQLLAEGRQLTQSMLSPTERHARELDRLNKLYRAGAIDGVTYRRAVEGADASLRRHTATVTKTADASAALIGRLKTMAAAYVGFQTVTKSVRLAVEVEQASAQFEILTGSVNNARLMMQQLRDFSDRSPITFSGAQDAAKTMLAFNIPVQEVTANLKMLGDISGGNQQRFEMLSLAFAQMSAAGRLMGQDLLQMINTGFNPLQEISRQTGESLVDLKKRMEQGGISADEVRKAFVSATSEGGKFAGLSDRLAETMGGKMTIAMSNLEKSGAMAGEAMGPLVVALTEGMEKGNSVLQGGIFLLEKFADGAGFAAATVKDMVNAAISLDFNAEWDATNKFLDSLEQRKRERQQKAASAGNDFEVSDNALDTMSATTKEAQATATAFEKQMQAMELQVAELTEAEYIVDRIRWAAEGYSVEQIEQLERQAEFVRGLKDEEEQIKKNAAEAERLAETFDRDVANARKAAMAYFEKERQRDAKMRSDVAAGPGAGMEVGSAGAAKYMADQMNQAIGAAAVPDRPTPGEREIIAQAMKELEEARKQTAEASKQTAAIKQLATTIEANAVKRAR